ncbi:MAG: biotin/lipoyl-binding protein [Gammaproteobacteria bacterium]|jgi:RND family efflux transporter MFP subunit
MKFPLSKKITLPILLLVAAVAGAWLLHATKPKTPPMQVEEQAWVVETRPLKLETVAPSLPLYGRVETPRTAKLAAAVSAEVREVPVHEGDAVHKGRLLVRLDDRDSRLQLASREADVREMQAVIDNARHTHDTDVAALAHEETLLKLNEKALQRAKDVAAKGLAAQSIVDDARQTVERQALSVATRRLAVKNFPAQLAQLRARLDKAMADRDTAALNVKRTRITAPFAGRIAKVTVAAGDRVDVGSALLELYDTQALELRAQIPTPHVATLRQALAKGEEVRGSGRSDGQPVSVVLARLAGQVQQGSGGIDGLFRVTAGRDTLALGQFVDLSVELAPVAGVAVLPATALYGMKRIYLLRDGRMAGIDVSVVGERRDENDSEVLVRSPQLHDGDQVIVTHLPNAIDGLRVKTAAAHS